MFCTSCGAKAQDGDMFCPECGAKLKHAAGAAASAGAPNYNAGNPFAQASAPAEKKARKNKGAGLIVALLLVVALAMLFFAACRGYLGEEIAAMTCGGSDSQSGIPVSGEAEPDSSLSGDEIIPAVVSPVDADEDAEVTTATTTATTTTTSTTTTTTTTTTTKPTTTTTTANAKKQEAEEIRKLLVSKTWTTELEGYNATIKFKKDGTATITVKVFLFSQSIDAQYSVNDDCHAVIMGEYGGNTYGISGIISKISNKELLVERDKNMGQVTLNAK